MSHCFHVQNQHTDTFLAPAVDMLVILAPPHPPKYNDHQWIGSQFNCHNVSNVSTAPQRPKCQKHQRMDRRLFAVCRALAESGRTARKCTSRLVICNHRLQKLLDCHRNIRGTHRGHVNSFGQLDSHRPRCVRPCRAGGTAHQH